jgi:hypothetical protein
MELRALREKRVEKNKTKIDKATRTVNVKPKTGKAKRVVVTVKKRSRRGR